MSEGVMAGKVVFANRADYCTVQQLIDALAKFPPQATIGVKAGRCTHAHSVVELRVKTADDWDDESEVILDAN